MRITTLFNGVFKNLTYKDFVKMSNGEFVHKDRIKNWMRKNEKKITNVYTSLVPSISI